MFDIAVSHAFPSARTRRARHAIHEPTVHEPPDAALGSVPETVIQDAWETQAFDTSALRTTEGAEVVVHFPGVANRYGGPDFLGADIEIDGLRWAGDVEIHRTSGEWESHRHHRDPAYDRVVLHVVLGADRKTGTLRRADGSALPELVLLSRLDQSLRTHLRSFALGARRPPFCAPRFADVPSDVTTEWVRSLGADRLRDKARAVGREFGSRPDLSLILTTKVFRALGYSANEVLMETLAAILPLAEIRALSDTRDVLALILGAAGWLEDPDLFQDGDADLAERFDSLRVDLGVRPIPRASWRTGGRPANAPRRRLAQAAALLAPGGLLHSADSVSMLAAAIRSSKKEAIELLRPEPSGGSPRLGATRAMTILVNAGVPVLLLDADMRGEQALAERVLELVGSLPAPSDHVTDQFLEAGFEAMSALEAQGLYSLARDFCEGGRCARCAVGVHLYPGLRRAEPETSASAAA